MVLTAQLDSPASCNLIGQLGSLVGEQGLSSLATRLADLQAWVTDDLRRFEQELEHVPRGANVVQRSAHHLLDLAGKHLRPMCVALASKVNGRFDDRARKLALAVELVHNATLLHDDVVDLGTTRRGARTARTIYGNAASVFAGDWLLIEALRHIRLADVPGLLDEMLSTIEEMILAESIQLENRGRINASMDDYFSVVEGKTAALFRWGMLAGARAGGLDAEGCQALESYGLHLGVAFQAVDDLLDIDGDSLVTGKALFTDVREGKMTYPLIVALERAPALMPLLQECAGLDADEELPPSALREIVATVAKTGALDDCRTLAKARARRAIEALHVLGSRPGCTALVTVAEASVYRES